MWLRKQLVRVAWYWLEWEKLAAARLPGFRILNREGAPSKLRLGGNSAFNTLSNLWVITVEVARTFALSNGGL